MPDSEPQQSPQEQDALDLDEETVADLDVDKDNADAVRGGPGNSGRVTCMPA